MRTLLRRPVVRMRPHVPQVVECAEGNQNQRDRGTEEHEREQHLSPPILSFKAGDVPH